MRALHLIAVAESWRPLAERLAAFGTQDIYPVGHENSPETAIISSLFLYPANPSPQFVNIVPNALNHSFRLAPRARHVVPAGRQRTARPVPGHIPSGYDILVILRHQPLSRRRVATPARSEASRVSMRVHPIPELIAEPKFKKGCRV